MTYLALVLGALALLSCFVGCVFYERQQAHRFFEPVRARFDAFIARMEFIAAHVDLGAFLKEEIRHAVTNLGHATVHLSLQIVRSVERFLTRLVRHLRTRREEEVPRETAREFVKTLSDFKDGLKTSHPDTTLPEVE